MGNKPSTIITLNIQGHVLQTNLHTLNKIPYFNAKLKDDDFNFFIDRSYHLFKHVIALATDPDYLFPEKYKSELNFYGIDVKQVKFYKKTKQTIEEKWGPTYDFSERSTIRHQKL